MSSTRFSVNDSVWVAAAVMSYELYQEGKRDIGDYNLQQSDIRNRATQINKANVEAARTSQWCCGDHEYHTCAYLKSVDAKRRLSFPEEFGGEKEEPADLDMSITVPTEHGSLTMKQLFDFVHTEYASLNPLASIDYLAPPAYVETEGKRAWLLTWNREHWDWDGRYKDLCAASKRGKLYTESWSCSNSHPVLGDDVFVIKTGAPPRGLMAHGTVSQEYQTEPHPDPDKAAQGATSGYIIADLDWIIDYEDETILAQDELKRAFPEQNWSPMASGIEIKPSVLPGLWEKWKQLTGAREDGFWPAPSVYDPGITTEQYLELFADTERYRPANMDTIYFLYRMGGSGTCKQCAQAYGSSFSHYVRNANTIAEKVARDTGCPLTQREDSGKNCYWQVLFYGKAAKDKAQGTFFWKLREPLSEAIRILDERGVFDDLETGAEETVEYDHNLILYGPPGTGKTYNSVVYAVAICEQRPLDDVKAEEYSAVKERYNQLVSEGRIAFTTFHQSYGYEEFIEGIKPVMDDEAGGIGYTVSDGVFKAFCERARKTDQMAEIDHAACVWFIRLKDGSDSDLKRECFKKGVMRFQKSKDTPTWPIERLRKMHVGDYIITYGGNSSFIDGIGKVKDGEITDDDSQPYGISMKVDWLIAGNGFKRDIREINGGKYLPNFDVNAMPRIRVSDLLAIVEEEKGNIVEENTQPFVFIIDEINRGNISKIFGELITLIEETKRAGAEEEMSATLPCSGEKFAVPANVYILGTMNTADRSIALMDTALRRRFSFKEMMPDSDVIADAVIEENGETLDVARMLDVINERIEYLYDREHTIGHAFFTRLLKEPTLDVLAGIFRSKVVPLLQEYFYEDYAKIQLVLGDNDKSSDDYKFILNEPVKVKNVFKGNPEDIADLPEMRYRIQDGAFDLIQSYKEIGFEQPLLEEKR